MTPAEQEFIALWEQGLEIAAIAQRLGIPRGTVSSRATALRKRGVALAKRPQGGAYPSQRAKARQEGVPAPAQAPAPLPADSALPTRDPPVITMVAVPELRELIHRFSGLEARVAALEDSTREVTRDPPAPARPPAAHPRADIKQWTVRLSQALIEAVKAQATTEGKEPSHLVEEVLWQALSDHRASTL